jgi:hypothetical protein
MHSQNVKKIGIKEILSRDFRPLVFFHQTPLFGPLFYEFELFRIYIRIHLDIWLSNRFFVISGVNDAADLWWAASMTPLTTGGHYCILAHRNTWRHSFVGRTFLISSNEEK